MRLLVAVSGTNRRSELRNRHRGTRFAFFPTVRHLDDAVQQSFRRFGVRPLVLTFGLFVAGCSVDALSLDTGPASRNQCSDDDECGNGRCVDAQCRSMEGHLTTLVVEVTPPADAFMVAGARFLNEVRDLDPAGGPLEISLGHVSRITGTVRAVDVEKRATCVPPPAGAKGQLAPDGTLPARVTLTPRARLLGMQTPTHTAATSFSAGASNQFSLNVPPSSYDVYVEPLAPSGDCSLPPQLFVGQEIAPGNVSLGLVLPAPQYLEVTVLWPDASDPVLEGWTLQVVEQDSGRVLSTEAILSEPEVTEGGLAYHALLAYSPVEASGTAVTLPSGTELVKLAPPEGLTAPVIIVQRNVLELFQEGRGVIDQLAQLPTPVKVTGQVSVQDQPEGVAATVTLVAKELRAIGAGTVAAFERVVESDASGQFEVDLLPGSYRVIATPAPDTGLAVTEVVWEIAADTDVQAGKTVELGPSPVLRGAVMDFAGRAVGGVAVQAAASPAPTFVDVLDRALGHLPVVPQAEGTVSRADGAFQVTCDPGTFDLWVRPEANSGFAWMVRPAVEVGKADVKLGTVQLPLPVEYRGTLRSSDVDSLPSALVRAYAYVAGRELTNDPSKATAVVQVAETRADEEGRFNLLLPTSFE